MGAAGQGGDVCEECSPESEGCVADQDMCGHVGADMWAWASDAPRSGGPQPAPQARETKPQDSSGFRARAGIRALQRHHMHANDRCPCATGHARIVTPSPLLTASPP